MKEEKHVTKKSNKFLYWSIALVILVAILIVIPMILPKDNPVIPSNNSASCIPEYPPVLGDKNAPLTIIEYSDFSCPFCEAAEGANEQYVNALKSRVSGWEAPVPAIKEEYVKTGKAKIVFKYFPGHGAAKPAHEVALALNEQCLFWQFAEKAFANSGDLNNLKEMKELAKSLGADMAKLESSLSNMTKIDDLLDKEMQEGLTNGVSGTPTFLINDKVVSGAQSFSAFKEVIDAEL